jgi:hypothetical protein
VQTYSTQFFAGAIGLGTTALYTVPTGFVVVVRDVTVYGNFATAEQVGVGLEVAGSISGYLLFANPLHPGDLAEWQGRQVINAGGVLTAVSGGSGPIVWASGYLLTA